MSTLKFANNEEMEAYIDSLSDEEVEKLYNQEIRNTNKAKTPNHRPSFANNEEMEAYIDSLSDEEVEKLYNQEFPKATKVKLAKDKDPSWVDRLARGVKAGVGHTGMLVENAADLGARYDPDAMIPTDDDEERYKAREKRTSDRHAKWEEGLKPLEEDDWLHTVGEFAGAAAIPLPGSGLVKSGKLLKTAAGGAKIKGFKPILKETTKIVKPLAKDITISGALGAENHLLKDAGMGDTAAAVTTVLTPFSLGALKHGASKAGYSSLGLGKGKLNVDLYEKAAKEGVQLPASVVADSKLHNLWKYAAKKSALGASQLDKQNAKLHRQILDQVHQAADKIGSKRDSAFNAKQAKLYEEARLAAEGKEITPTAAIDHIKGLKQKKKSGRNSPFERELSKELALLEKDGEAVATPVAELINRKQLTNEKLFHTNTSNPKTLTRSERKDQQDFIRAYHKQFEEAAKNKPEHKEWYDKLAQADKQHAKAAKREQFEELFADNVDTLLPEEFKLADAGSKLRSSQGQQVIKDVIKTTPELTQKLNTLSEILNEISKKGTKIKTPAQQAVLSANAHALGALAAYTTKGLSLIPPSVARIANSQRVLKRAVAAARSTNPFTVKNLNDTIQKELLTKPRYFAVSAKRKEHSDD